jgi:elongation factor Ts
MGVSAQEVKVLRERTGAGMMDCREALHSSGGDMDKAVVWLREKGKADAATRMDRIAREGGVAAYVHMGGKIGVLVEVNCETDFVARSEPFRDFCKDLCHQICSMAPRWVKREDIPKDVIVAERDIHKARARQTGKPERILDKIAEGMLNKWFQEVCLMEQEFVREPGRNLEQLAQELSGKVGEKIEVRRFVRFQLGEGVEGKPAGGILLKQD